MPAPLAIVGQMAEKAMADKIIHELSCRAASISEQE
jgi:hypothetical protein